jgi:hypothetical protein
MSRSALFIAFLMMLPGCNYPEGKEVPIRYGVGECVVANSGFYRGCVGKVISTYAMEYNRVYKIDELYCKNNVQVDQVFFLEIDLSPATIPQCVK